MSLRKPKEQYKNRNGFEEYNRQFPAESMKDVEAAEAQDFARFVIREMGSFFPSLEDMKREVEAPETIASITERIKRLKKEHADGMSQLSRYYVQELHSDEMDRYLQTDDLKYFNDHPKGDEWAEHYERLKAFFRRSGHVYRSEFFDVLVRAQYDHLQELLPLYKRRRELEGMDNMSRIKRAAQFPQSIRDYRGMELKDAQLRVARFLMADNTKRDQMRSVSQWAWRQTQPLILQYEGNDEFRREIAGLVRENESKDPRARNRVL